MRQLSPASRGKIAGMVLALLIALAIVGASIAWGKPPPHRLAPPIPCTSKNRMDIFIDEDNIMYACECEWLVTMPLCNWQVIGGVDAPAARKYRRRHPRASVAWSPRLIPILVVHA